MSRYSKYFRKFTNSKMYEEAANHFAPKDEMGQVKMLKRVNEVKKNVSKKESDEKKYPNVPIPLVHNKVLQHRKGPPLPKKGGINQHLQHHHKTRKTRNTNKTHNTHNTHNTRRYLRS